MIQDWRPDSPASSSINSKKSGVLLNSTSMSISLFFCCLPLMTEPNTPIFFNLVLGLKFPAVGRQNIFYFFKCFHCDITLQRLTESVNRKGKNSITKIHPGTSSTSFVYLFVGLGLAENDISGCRFFLHMRVQCFRGRVRKSR